MNWIEKFPLAVSNQPCVKGTCTVPWLWSAESDVSGTEMSTLTEVLLPKTGVPSIESTSVPLTQPVVFR